MRKYTKPVLELISLKSDSIITLSGINGAQEGTAITSVFKSKFGSLNS